MPDDKTFDPPLVVGYDAAGEVVAVGSECKLFKKGDKVMFAGDKQRQGTNAEYAAVDERVVGKKPESFDFGHAAALPLVGLTAYEGLVEQGRLAEGGDYSAMSVLIIGGSGAC